MTYTLTDAAVDSITVQKLTAVDGQGKPSYAAAVTVKGRAARDEQLVKKPDGSTVRIIAEAWIQGDQSILPSQGDRVGAAGLTGIVETRYDGKTLAGDLDHIRVQIRKE